MGTKGVKSTKKATATSEWLEDSLSDIGIISRRKMFGGYGVFESGAMFALISPEGTVHFKANESNLERFEKAGSEKHGRMPYYSVPDEILKNQNYLCDWAILSIKIAHETPTKKKWRSSV